MTSNNAPTTKKRSYDELKINGPPLFKQGSIPDSYKSPQKCNSLNHNTSYCPPLDASRTALLIVDVQPEYWSECPAVRKDFPNFPSQISSLINNCRDQHMKRIIWVRADYSYKHSPWLHQFARLHEGRIPPVVRPSSKWEEFAQPSTDEMIITKTSWSSTSDTNLLDTLKQDGIDTVLVCGLITSVCVQHSAFGVFEAGYRTILVTDACADRGKERHEAALALYGDYMYELRTVKSLHNELLKSNRSSQGSKSGGGGKRISLSFDDNEADAGDNGHEDIMVKSESYGSLTSATSNADSISSIDNADEE